MNVWLETRLEKLDETALARRAHGMIEAGDGRLTCIRLRPWPKMISVLEIELWGRRRHHSMAGDRCLLFYNQSRRWPNYLALNYVVSQRDCTMATMHAALAALDEVARIKRSDAILCDVWNSRLTERMLARYGWESHKPGRWHRHYIKRFYGVYPPSRQTTSAEAALADSAASLILSR